MQQSFTCRTFLVFLLGVAGLPAMSADAPKLSMPKTTTMVRLKYETDSDKYYGLSLSMMSQYCEMNLQDQMVELLDGLEGKMERECQKVVISADATLSPSYTETRSNGSSTSSHQYKYLHWSIEIMCSQRDLSSQAAYNMWLHCQKRLEPNCLAPDVKATIARWKNTEYDVPSSVAQAACAGL